MTIIYEDNTIVIEQLKIIYKSQIIYSILSEILNNSIFDKIRTNDKIGYIVQCNFKYYNSNNKIIMTIQYVIQSEHDMHKINESIINFNDFFYSDFKKNSSDYEQTFKTLKESRLLNYKKEFTNLQEEVSTYITSIILKTNILNPYDLLYSICHQITFNDFNNAIKNIFDTKSSENLIQFEIKLDNTFT
jgi:secreted Zn-dependent insulinase-like peptidase